MQVANSQQKGNFSKTNKTSFGMKFQFKRLDIAGDWHGADREFFNTTYQLGLIQMEVSKLKPKSDTFQLQLGLPEGDVLSDKNGILTTSYRMFVNIIRKNKVIATKDLSEKNIKLNALDYQDKLEVRQDGPCSKALAYIKTVK